MADKKINLVVADMGYGHQRAAYPLLDLAGGEAISTNNYPGIPDWEKKYWLSSRKSYEAISRFKKIPLVGGLVFKAMDELQEIDPFYPFRDLSKMIIQQKFYRQSLQKGLGKDLIDKLSADNLPLVTTFFVAAYMAEYFNFPGEVYSIICDADASRAWGPFYPKDSRIKFFLPSERVKKRFLMYGVKPENLFVTGFPLPKENVGHHQEILKADLARRLKTLDIHSRYNDSYHDLIARHLPDYEQSAPGILTITFAVGGAGAQKEIGALILDKLVPKIKNGEIKLNLVAGVRPEVRDYFHHQLERHGVKEGNGVGIIFAEDKTEYFKMFNDCLHETDILWTKPSELSFYSSLGLPIIMSEPVGSQEDFNRQWLISTGAGIDSYDPKYVDEWLFDLLSSGRLARAAMDGFLNGEAMGTYNIEKIISESGK